jgi:hypothetical protein
MKKAVGLSVATVVVLIGLGACVADQDITPGGSSDGDAAPDGSGGGGDGSPGSSDGGGGDSSPPPTAPPTHAAAGVSFVDVDPVTGTVGGSILIRKAADESDVSEYVIYLTDASGTKPTTPLTSVKASGKNLSFKIAEGSAIPPSVTQVLVSTKNAIGEMPSGPTGAYADATAQSVTVSDPATTILRTIGSNANVLFDDNNRQVIVTTGDQSAFACALADESCKQHDISAGVTASGVGASAIDTVNGKLITLAAGSTGTIQSFFAPLDFSTAATNKDLTNGLSGTQQGSPAIAIDRGKKLYVVTSSSTGSDQVFDCALDGTGCSTAKSLLTTEIGGNAPSLAIDDNTSHLFMGSGALAGSNPYLVTCPLNLGVDCSEATAASNGGGIRTTMLVDTVNLKTLVVGTDSSYQAYLNICNSSGGACTTVNLTTDAVYDGHPYDGSAEFAKAAIDLVDKKLIVVIEANGSNATAMLRCELNGTSCTRTTFTATGRHLDVAVDPESGQVFGLAQDISGGNPFLFFMQ